MEYLIKIKTMKKILILIILTVSLLSQAQDMRVHEKVELSYEYVELYKDSIHIATIKTHSNFDVLDGDYFIYWSSGSERVYHFLYPESCGYDLNRMSFTKTNADYIYKNDFKLFGDSIGVRFQSDRLFLFTKDYRSLRFHN